MRIAVGSDHAGFRLKQVVAGHLRGLGHEVLDLGTYDESSTDYPDHARSVAVAITEGKAEQGVLVCGTGQGMAMTANRFKGIRAAVVNDAFSARLVREHNDANVLCLGQRVIGEGQALECVDAWVNARFEGGRHERRVKKIEDAGA